MSNKVKFDIFCLLLPVITLIYGIFTKKYDVVFNSLLTVFCILAFAVIHKKFSIFTDGTYCACVIFILLSVFAGRTLKVYNLISQWDKVLHFTSGFIIFAIGKQVYAKLNGDIKNRTLMNWFALLFAIAAAGIWEFYEFFIDSILNMSAQNGLVDTMLDMIAGTVSALIAVALKEIISYNRSR